MPIPFTPYNPNSFAEGYNFVRQGQMEDNQLRRLYQQDQMAAEDRATQQRRQGEADARVKAKDAQDVSDRERELLTTVYAPLSQRAIQSGNPRQFFGQLVANPQTRQMLLNDGIFEESDLQDPEFEQHVQAIAALGASQDQQKRVQSTFVGKNGNMWVVDANGGTRDTGTPVSQFAQRPVEAAGGVYAFDPAKGQLGGALATPEQQRGAAAAQAGAVAGAKATAENAATNSQAAFQNKRAYDTYLAGLGNVEKRLAATQTDPLTGRILPLTANAQAAEGAIAAMAPVLKGLFRQAGEGTFTDRDQALLIEMLPTRKDHPEARKAKIESINAIVRAKLGMASGQASSGDGWSVEVIP